MILADTSSWIEYDRATGSAIDERLTTLITDGDGDRDMLAVTEPVMLDVLSGARTGPRGRPATATAAL